MTPPTTTLAEDLRWLEAQKLTGHCGEGNVELKARHHHNERIDRLIAGLILSAHGGRKAAPKDPAR